PDPQLTPVAPRTRRRKTCQATVTRRLCLAVCSWVLHDRARCEGRGFESRRPLQAQPGLVTGGTQSVVRPRRDDSPLRTAHHPITGLSSTQNSGSWSSAARIVTIHVTDHEQEAG